jgi:hypothetical protein
MKATDVFTPQRLPTVTLVTDHLKGMKTTYDRAIEEGGKLIRVVGPSKSGKTVFIKSAAGTENTVIVTGAGVTSPDLLWTRILHAIGSDTGQATERVESTSGGYKVSGEVEGNILVAKAKANGEVNRGRSSEASLTQTKAIDLLQAVIADLANSGLTIFVDDFHYISTDVQTALAQQIKRAVEAGVRIATAAVPFRSEDVLRANDDLQGRIVDFNFKYWSDDELVAIAKQGFVTLNVVCSDDFALSMAQEAAGSPQLMQSLCLEACYAIGASETAERPIQIPDERGFLAQVCNAASKVVDFSTTINVMREGPLIRGNPRKAYVLKDDTAEDVYQILVRAIAMDPPKLHFSYSDMQTRVAALCKSDSPHFSDSCFHMARLVNDRSNSDKLDWNAEQHRLSIRDPYLLFGIRWGGNR